MITGKGLRPSVARHVIAALRHAVDYSYPATPNSLTDAEVGILRCLLFRIRGRYAQVRASVLPELGPREGIDDDV
jgi:hypothetical protein